VAVVHRGVGIEGEVIHRLGISFRESFCPQVGIASSKAYDGVMSNYEGEKGGDNMDTCDAHGDPYLYCEGEIARRDFVGQTLCSAHQGAAVVMLAYGLGPFAPANA